VEVHHPVIFEPGTEGPGSLVAGSSWTWGASLGVGRRLVGHRAQGDPEDAVRPPEGDAVQGVSRRDGVRQEEGVLDSPRVVLAPGVDDDARTEDVGHVGVGVLALPVADVHHDVREQGPLFYLQSRVVIMEMYQV